MKRETPPTDRLLRKLDQVVLCGGKHSYRGTFYKFEDKRTSWFRRLMGTEASKLTA